MNSTQNKKISQVKETTMIVGVDIGSENLYCRIIKKEYKVKANNLILNMCLTFNYSGFNLYYRWIKQLDAEKYGTVIKAERFIRHWRDIVQEDIYSFGTLEEIGKYLFDRVKIEVGADDKFVKIALKRINYYPFNNRGIGQPVKRLAGTGMR